MGGSAFTSEPYLLNTPRMPPATYHKVQSACHARLRELYVYVASPIEGPGKEDHGDVDVIVFLERRALTASGPQAQLPHPRGGREPLETIAAALGAEHVIYLKPHLTSANMAVPWPEEEEEEQGKDKTGTEKTPPDRRRHVQVDVHIAQSLAEFQWWLFRHAHGDFWQLVGTTIRPLGLTVDEEALWVRIPEIEARDRKRSKVMLTSDPDEVLEFLGYKGYKDSDGGSRSPDDRPGPGGPPHGIADDTGLRSVWDRPFDTVDQLFAYVATSRWFWVAPPKPPPNPEGPKKPDSSDPSSLRSNDRRRLKQRRVYAQWAESYLPSLSLSSASVLLLDRTSSPQHAEFSLLTPADRQLAVREAAFERWPAVRETYARRLEAYHLQTTVEDQQRAILGYVREAVARLGQEENWNNVAVGALRKIVFSGDASFGVVPVVPLRDDGGRYDVAEAEKFVRDMGRRVGDEAWKVMCARGRKAMEDKARKRAMLAERQSQTKEPEVQESKKISAETSDAGGSTRNGMEEV